jgi:hypothetical protein
LPGGEPLPVDSDFGWRFDDSKDSVGEPFGISETPLLRVDGRVWWTEEVKVVLEG